ncbi:MAG: hypothetical protein ACFFAS_01130 [Promethearchaeota archaeon]
MEKMNDLRLAYHILLICGFDVLITYGTIKIINTIPLFSHSSHIFALSFVFMQHLIDLPNYDYNAPYKL